MARSLTRMLSMALALSVCTTASAQDPDCRSPARAPLEVSPASGAGGAALDAPVLVRYGAGYFGPEGPGDPPSSLIQFFTCGPCGSPCDLGSGTPVPGLVQTQGDDLIFLPDGGLTAQTAYVGLATGIDGELQFNFCTGSGHDTQPPSAAGIGEPTSAHVGSVACLPEGGYRIQVYFAPATDLDGPPGSIEYLLFQTRGVGIDAPVLVDRVRNFQTDRITMSYLLSNHDAATPICLQVVTIDGNGHAAVPAGDRCFDPVGHITFQGCGVSNAASPRHRVDGMLGLVAIAALALARRRRR